MFRDRREAGRILAERLLHYRDDDDVLVLGLPRGGVPVAFEVASRLRAPLDAFLVRKLGVPGHEELAMGAVATGGVKVLNRRVVALLGISNEVIEAAAAREQAELERRENTYRGDRPAFPAGGRIAIVVDDGLATGATMRAAVRAVRQEAPKRIVVAVPVGTLTTCTELEAEADEVVCASSPEDFVAVGLWYEDFSPTSDDEVRDLLRQSQRWARDKVGHAQ